ncbi:uroporphyrinogen-III synthase [Shumkonia mesophila]|uniref:uroporphyrinogen-III synthase n=1 Tax=Shumkonia mesophila TaxID=2838854 RepID=UPI002934ED9D|nr:uroporphyrinogen-III synthase [Shumkonia mesophila]
MRVLLTRPREDAEPLAGRLHGIGIETIIEPLLAIEIDRTAAVDLEGVQAILATSANGVRALAALCPRRDLPVLAVGDATAATAREAGFLHVDSAAGDVEALAALAIALCRPEHGALLHVAGSHLAGDLKRRVEAGGLSYRRAVLYASRPAERLSAEAATALKAGEVDGVLFFSPRTAETFVTLIREARLVKACRKLAAFCLSEAVAERARGVAWRRVLVASRPDLDSLLGLMTDGTQGPWGTMTETPKTPDETAETAAARDAETPAAVEPMAAAQAAAAAESPPPAEEIAAPAAERRPAPRAASRASLVPLAVLSSLLLLAVLGGIVYAAWPFWSPYVVRYVQSIRPNAVPDPRFGELAGRVQALEEAPRDEAAAGDAVAELERARSGIGDQIAALLERVNGLEKSLEGVRAMVKATGLPGEAADARKSLDELSERIAKLEQTEASTRVNEGLERFEAEKDRLTRSLAEVTQRMEGLEERTQLAGAPPSVRALVLAAGQLREALRANAPFAEELAALRKTAGEEPDLVQLVSDLTPHAATGIPVLATLMERFDATARKAVAAERRFAGDGWLAAAANRLASLVTIRRTAVEEADTTTEALIARAEAAMQGGDLAGAVKALEGLEGAAAEAMGDWLKQARQRLLAERAMAVLHVHAVSLIAPAGK